MEVARRLVGGLLEAINAHDVDRIVTFYAEDVTIDGLPAGAPGMRALYDATFTAFPDLRIDVLDLITAADRAVVRGRVLATHAGRVRPPLDRRLFGGVLAGRSPTHRLVNVDAVHIWELSGGAIVAEWAVRDHLSMQAQLDTPL